MDNMVREQSLEDIERLHVAREEAQNSFWDCVRPDESPAGDRTKAAGILVSGVEAVRARCVKVSCGLVPRNALAVTIALLARNRLIRTWRERCWNYLTNRLDCIYL
jgi:hypothetical protein